MKVLTEIIMGLLLMAVLLSAIITEVAYGQTTPQEEESTTMTNTTAFSAPRQLITPSPSAQQIINNTKAECEEAQFFQPKCVELVYESPATVVVKGLVLIFGGSPERESRAFYSNPFLWKAVDAFKAQGYRITDVEETVLGNRSANAEYNVIMSK
jgi:hypothetical protein